MTGEDLYNEYARLCELHGHGYGFDDWYELDGIGQHVWNELARSVEGQE